MAIYISKVAAPLLPWRLSVSMSWSVLPPVAALARSSEGGKLRLRSVLMFENTSEKPVEQSRECAGAKIHEYAKPIITPTPVEFQWFCHKYVKWKCYQRCAQHKLPPPKELEFLEKERYRKTNQPGEGNRNGYPEHPKYP
jgi:hypothetical protein